LKFNTAEILIDEVGQVFQDEIVKNRIEDINWKNRWRNTRRL